MGARAGGCHAVIVGLRSGDVARWTECCGERAADYAYATVGPASAGGRQAYAASLDRSYPKRLTVPIDSLVQKLPGYVSDHQFRGELIRYLQCGPYTVRLKGGFYNANIDGQLGAYPSFATVNIFAENRMIAPSGPDLAIGECERGNRLAPECPAEWATRIDATYDARREEVRVTEQVSSMVSRADDPAVGRERAERQYEAGESVVMWAHARDARKAQAKGTP